MNEPKTPFKVGETYPDGDGDQVEIIHIRQDKCDFPMIGVSRWLNGSGVRCYTLTGCCSAYSRDGGVDLIPPAPPMKRVPLGSQDVPPGSVFSRAPELGWFMVSAVHPDGIKGECFWSWDELRKVGFQIKRPGGDWQPMWKEVPEEGGLEG